MAVQTTRAVLTLALVGTVCGGLLHTVNSATRPQIEQNHAQARWAVFRELLPPTVEVSDMPANGLFGDCSTWLAATLTHPGYGGDIELAYLWTAGNKQVSLRVVRHRETPGFGDFITGPWLADRDQGTADQWQAVDRVSGATITFNAVTRAALDVLTRSEAHCREG